MYNYVYIALWLSLLYMYYTCTLCSFSALILHTHELSRKKLSTAKGENDRCEARKVAEDKLENNRM